MGGGIDGPEDVVPLPPGPGRDHPPDQAPQVAEERPADEVGGVGEQHPAFTGRRFGQPRPELAVEELLLGDGVGLGRHAPGLAIPEAQLF